MRRAGTVVRIAQGMAVARSDDESHPGIGAEVVDESLEPVGRVVDVIGPVARPYLVVDPTGTASPAGLLNQRLYVR